MGRGQRTMRGGNQAAAPSLSETAAAAAAAAKMRGILGDASNRRLTRSLHAAKEGSAAVAARPHAAASSAAHDDDEGDSSPAQRQRRSARLCQEEEKKKQAVERANRQQRLKDSETNETAVQSTKKRGRSRSVQGQQKRAKRDTSSGSNGGDAKTTTTTTRGRSRSAKLFFPSSSNSSSSDSASEQHSSSRHPKKKKKEPAPPPRRGRSRSKKTASKTTKQTARTSSQSAAAAKKKKTNAPSFPAAPRPRLRSRSRQTRSSSSSAASSSSSLVVQQSKRTLSSSSSSRRWSLSSALSSHNYMDETNHNMAVSFFDPTRFTRGMSLYDVPNSDDPLQAPEYVADILQRLYHAETQSRVRPYMHTQTEITAAMRAILIDWLVEVHKKFRLVPDTLYLCVAIIDRYLSKAHVARSNLQLVGITSLLIACKYEEIYPPEVRDCVYITDRAFTRQDVLDMEITILTELQFMISMPTAYPFLQRFLWITGASPTMRIAANYYSDRMLQEHDLLEYRPSLVAAAAVCLSLNHDGIRDFDEVETPRPHIHEALLQYTGFCPQEILTVASLVAEKIPEESMIAGSTRRKLVSVKNKYDVEQYEFISDFSPPTVEHITLPPPAPSGSN